VDLQAVYAATEIDMIICFSLRGDYDRDNSLPNNETLTPLPGDYLGSASLATNASGAKITDSDTRYYPYGVTRPGLAGTGLPTDRRFTGQREEASLGCYDYGARPYDPAQRQGGVLTCLHGDPLGSASLATNASGAKITNSDTRYYPYGVTRPGLAGTGLPTDRRFTGQREESSLGFYDYGARQFDPALGRFLQADTIVPNPANPQSLNRYSYTLGNQLRYTDPSGHIAQEEETDAQSIVAYLRLLGFEIQIDWGMVAGFWNAGLWQLRELQLIQQAVSRLEQVFQGKPIQGSIISVVRANEDGTAANIQDSIIIRNDFLKAAILKSHLYMSLRMPGITLTVADSAKVFPLSGATNQVPLHMGVVLDWELGLIIHQQTNGLKAWQLMYIPNT